MFRDLKTPSHLRQSCSQTQDPSMSPLCKLTEICSRDKSGLACRATQANDPTTDLSCDFSASYSSSVLLTPVLYEIRSIFSAVDLHVTLTLPSSLCAISLPQNLNSPSETLASSTWNASYLLYELLVSWFAWKQKCHQHAFPAFFLNNAALVITTVAVMKLC